MKRIVALAALVWLAACGEEKDPPQSQAPSETIAESDETNTAIPEVPEPEEPPAEPEAPEPPPVEPVTTPTPPPPPFVYELDNVLRLNHVQMKGTHNSYHVSPEKYTSPAWEYDMPPLEDQAGKYGVRSFELDVHWVRGKFRVYHWDVDPGTKCELLKECLVKLRDWSDKHPTHAPLIIFLELKYDAEDSIYSRLDEFENLVKDTWPGKRTYKPDDLTGDKYPDVQTALRERGWPTLGKVRGKAIFVLMASADVQMKYANHDAGLRGRRLFVSSGDTSWRHAGFILFDDVVKLSRHIAPVARSGLIVRTRADAIPTMGNPADYPAQWRLALDSGAHIIATDYPVPYRIAGYDTTIPGGNPLRCNPITAPERCTPEQIESLP